MFSSSPTYVILFIKNILLYLNDIARKGGYLNPLHCFSNRHNNQTWTRLQLGTRTSSFDSHMAAGAQILHSFSSAFLGTLIGKWNGNELSWSLLLDTTITVKGLPCCITTVILYVFHFFLLPSSPGWSFHHYVL